MAVSVVPRSWGKNLQVSMVAVLASGYFSGESFWVYLQSNSLVTDSSCYLAASAFIPCSWPSSLSFANPGGVKLSGTFVDCP